MIVRIHCLQPWQARIPWPPLNKTPVNETSGSQDVPIMVQIEVPCTGQTRPPPQMRRWGLCTMSHLGGRGVTSRLADFFIQNTPFWKKPIIFLSKNASKGVVLFWESYLKKLVCLGRGIFFIKKFIHFKTHCWIYKFVSFCSIWYYINVNFQLAIPPPN